MISEEDPTAGADNEEWFNEHVLKKINEDKARE